MWAIHSFDAFHSRVSVVDLCPVYIAYCLQYFVYFVAIQLSPFAKNQLIRVCHHHADRILYAAWIIIAPFARACQIILAVHQIVVPNAQSIQIVQRIWHAFVINAKIRASVPAVQMPSAQFSIIDRIAVAWMDSLAIHLAVVSETFCVRNFHFSRSVLFDFYFKFSSFSFASS